MFEPLNSYLRRSVESSANLQAGKQRKAKLGRRLDVESLEPRQLLSGTPEFQVLNDATTNIAYRYSVAGAAQGSYALAPGNSAPRGAASLVGVEKSWVVDANRNVYVYNSAGGTLMGSWSAGSMPNNATPEGIATDGNDVWIVDSRSDRVYRYAGAASRLSGSHLAISSFGGIGSNPKDIVTDGAHLWILNDGSRSDQVHKFHVTNGYWGSWTIDSANKSPTGITLDPASVGDMWISDSGTDRVYKYAAATSLTGGSQGAASSFALGAGNGNSVGLVVPGRPWAEASYSVSRVHQFGSAGDEVGRGISADGLGNVYVSGWTTGSLFATNPTGQTAPFLASYDSDLNSRWVEQPTPVTGENDEGRHVAADNLGNVFQIVGGGLNNYDAASGELLWNTSLPIGEVPWSVSTDGLGYAYTSSYGDNFAHIRKFDAQTGNIVWHNTLDTGGVTNSSGVSVDGLGNVYLTGYTRGSTIRPNVGGADAFIAKYSDAGVELWKTQFGSPGDDYNFQIRADSLGNIFTSGGTYGSFGAVYAGGQDIFLSKHDAAGNLRWIRQWGTSGEETVGKIWADNLGNVFLAGSSPATLAGTLLGGDDIVATKFDTNGNQLWSTQFGTNAVDVPSGGGFTGDALGNLYITGRTAGAMDGPNLGGTDAVIIKLSPPTLSRTGDSLGSLDADSSRAASVNGLSTAALTGSVSAAISSKISAASEKAGSKYLAMRPNDIDLELSTAMQNKSLLAHELAFASFATERPFAPMHRATRAAAKRGNDDANCADTIVVSHIPLDGFHNDVFVRLL